jgi:ubiquinone/menaquinone biosynthesis C-methylase UbiE
MSEPRGGRGLGGRRRSPGSRKRSRAASVVLWGLAVAHVAEAFGLRRRWRNITALPSAAAGGHAEERGDKVEIVSISGAEIDAATRAGAASEMELCGAQVVDLVPGDLPADRALRLLRRVSPTRLGDDAMYSPGGAHEVLVLHHDVAGRMGGGAGRGLLPLRTADRGELVRRTVKAQRYAPTATALRRAPALRTSEWSPSDRWRELEELHAYSLPGGKLAPVLLGAETAHLLALTAGPLISPVAGLVALGTWVAQPAGVLGARGVRAGPLRLPRAWVDNLRTALAGYRAGRRAAADRARTPVPAAPRVEELFEPRRTTCPWCGSHSLVGRLDTTDLFQHKQGTFHLDQCTDCGHTFQNPAVSGRGLNYYYDQFYDGISEEQTEVVFASLGKAYRNRIQAVGQFTEPQSWLDVGTGHGHFCLAARQRWPDARIDGLDMSETVEEAQRRGWIDTAYRGIFLELAEGLPRSYEVVSMHHYLEHTLDPRRELAAAAKVVEPGGYLMVEVPDPESPWSRRLGRFWLPWMQPQHMHFVPCGNLVKALEESSFEVVSVERGPATMGADLSAAAVIGVEHLAPSSHLPWLPPPSPAQRAKRAAVIAGALPFIGLALLVDRVRDACIGPRQIGNAYRVVARRL